jgi:hypothetical protein
MIAVMVFVTTSSLLLASAYDRMNQLFAFEESSDRIASDSDGTEEALGAAVARLQTGVPTVNGSNQYLCDLRLRNPDGTVKTFRIIYRKLTKNEWWVRARTPLAALPICPTSFTTNACPAPL